MTFDELKFKAEEFETLMVIMGSIPIGRENGFIIAECANRILKEKLEQAPEHYMFYQDGMWWSHEIYLSKDTHKARLVCIEEIK